MDIDKIIAINLENAKLVTKGIYINLQCPRCDNRNSEAYFSNQEEKYGIWFECKNCGNIEHISCREQPKGYTLNRLSKKYQNLDKQAWSAENIR